MTEQMTEFLTLRETAHVLTTVVQTQIVNTLNNCQQSRKRICNKYSEIFLHYTRDRQLVTVCLQLICVQIATIKNTNILISYIYDTGECKYS